MGRFVYGPCSFVGTFLLGLAVVAAAFYLITVPPVDRYVVGRECIEARDTAGKDELADEWAVYQALMKEERLSESQLLIHADSLSFGSSADKPVVPEASAVTNIDYKEKNRRTHSLSCLFASKGASFITEEEIKKFPESYSWGAFRLSHPLTFGVLWLSRVGFDHDRKEAIVSFAYSCGGPCGWGATVKLAKIGGKWQKNNGPQFGIYD